MASQFMPPKKYLIFIDIFVDIDQYPFIIKLLDILEIDRILFRKQGCNNKQLQS